MENFLLVQPHCGTIRTTHNSLIMLNKHRTRVWGMKLTGSIFFTAVGGCGIIIPPPDTGNGANPPVFNNTTDPTNMGAQFVGAAACSACHPGIAEQHQIHGHSQVLKQIQGTPPEFPVEGERAGVPNPPEGFSWADVAYLIGGYTRKAQFVDLDGFVLTTGEEGVPTQWNVSFPANGTSTEFVSYESSAEMPHSYDFSCFQCHTTGPLSQNEGYPHFQENRPGIPGTWAESGVQCEACHGPGSNHVPNPAGRDIFVGNSADNCGKCHTRGNDPNVILANGGYIQNYEQWPELLASGGHADFACITCHDPHSGTNYDRQNAIRNECTSCHADQNMAIHEGFTFMRGDYVEQITCESCHMPYATLSASSAPTEVVGEIGRMGDTQTHIFRINTTPSDYRAFFSGDGSAVVKDGEGRAAVTLDFVCFRCHNGVGNAGTISSLDLASGVASEMHSIVRP